MKIAIVTGASRGIGRAIALKLCDSFDVIGITSLKSKEALEETASQIKSKGKIAFCELGDSGDYHFIEGFIKEITEAYGNNISLLVNNAGISYVGLLTDMKPEEFDLIMKTNIYSVYNTCSQVVPYMVSNKKGKIINVSSVWGNTGAACEVAYSATKAAINGFTRALAKELAPSNISVNAIAFGAIDTEMNSHLNKEERQMLCDEIPAGYMASPEQAADFAASLWSSDAYLNGQVIAFDGAWQ